MLTRSSEPQQKSLQITADDKFYTRLLSKETSMANPSFRVYYGGASSAVPFMWESQPGTPKNTIPTTTLPPLTPPPSYHTNPKAKGTKRSPRKNLLLTLLPGLTLKKSPSSPSLASLSSSSVSSSGSSGSHRRSRQSSPRSSLSSRFDDEDSDSGSPRSPLCFGVRRGGSPKRCYSMVIMKNALLYIVGGHHGSG